MKNTPVIDAECTDVNIEELLKDIRIEPCKRGQHYPHDRNTGEKIRYLGIVTAFDIETSKAKTVTWGWQAWLYHWQWQLGEVCTLVGRSWESFLYIVGKLNFYLDKVNARMLVFVHELAYEFQYLAGVWPFEPADLFATGQYAPLWAMMGKLEFRCSRRLANCNLADWSTKIFRVDHPKLVDALDHEQVHYPWTKLTDEELKYCINDVVAVVECVTALMEKSRTNLYSLPLTAIGFVRKRCKDATWLWSRNGVQDMQNPLYVYDRLREANRGGDCYLSDDRREQLLGDVESWDRSSSYPDVIAHCKFPMTKFKEESPTLERFKYLVEHGKAVLMKVAFYKLKRKQDARALRYIPYLKCCEKGFKKPVKPKLEDGRIEAAEYCEIAITDLDMELIMNYYEWEGIDIEWLMSARYGYLPQPLVDEVVSMYCEKTRLKGDEERKEDYNYTKVLLNSIYGMMSQRLIYTPVTFENGEWKLSETDREADYAEAVERAFLNYAWSVWVTAWGRYRLHEGIQAVMSISPDAFVYADTDSVKVRMIHPDFDKINNERIKDAEQSRACGMGADGVMHYMGAFEKDGVYKYFRALNVKRYCVVEDHNRLVIHVAGVPQQKGAEVLLKHGGILAFDYSFNFTDVGQTRTVMNDLADITITIDGHKLHITRNAVIIPIEEVGDYESLVTWANAMVDIIEYSDYTPGV